MTAMKVKMGQNSARVLRHLQVVVLEASCLPCTSLHGSINPENLRGDQVRKYMILVIKSRRTKNTYTEDWSEVSIPTSYPGSPRSKFLPKDCIS